MISKKVKEGPRITDIHRNDNIWLTLFTIPALFLTFIFGYLPMAGIWMAFVDFRFDQGIFGSQFAGLDNFWVFGTPQITRIIRNTLGYGFGLQLVGHLAAIILALLLYEVRSRKALKFYQTTFTIPNYMSWVIISYVVYIFLSPSNGVLNSLIEFFGGERINAYTMPGIWPFVLTIVNTWNLVGIRSIIYFAALLSIDPGLFEAAKVDGAGRLKQVWYISLPSILPTFMILFILGMRDILRGDIGLFFNVTRDVGLLYPTTDVLDTYIFRALRAGHFETATAVGLVQSFVGMIVIFAVNKIVKTISPGSELF